MDKVIHKKLQQLDGVTYSLLKNECLNLIQQLNWNNGINQIMLQTHDPNIDDFLSGTGRIADAIYTDETKYSYIQPSLKDSRIDRLLSSMNVFRTRLMLVKPKTCYSIHNDPSSRLHLALDTNPQCLFLFPDQKEFIYIPEDRAIHYINTTENHSFANCSNIDRIHLVMSTKVVY